MTLSAQIFKRALAEKLAFIPPPQAPGPAGEPVGPQPGGMDAAAGPAPGGDPAAMDPAAAGAPPVDPAAAGAPPVDPAAAGAPPVDPASAGAPPIDPAMLEALAAGAGGASAPEAPPSDDGNLIDEQSKAQQQLGQGDAMVPLSQLKEFAVGIIEATKGKKTMDAPAKAPAAAGGAPADPQGAPGPITGLPGFDPSSMQGPIKMGSVIRRIQLKQARVTKSVLFRK